MTLHEGACHCGEVTFAVEADLAKTMTCNCSHCAKKGFILTFVPADKFALRSGEAALSEYLFHQKVIRHQFCQTCGVQPFAYGEMPDGSPTVAVNVRCLDDVDLTSLDPTPVDGRSF